MIKDYLEILNEKDLYLLKKSGKLYHESKIDKKSGKKIAYFMNDQYFKNNNNLKNEYKLSNSLFDICNTLKELSAIKHTLREIDNDYWLVAIDDINFKKIKLLYEILHKQPNKKDKYILNIIREIIKYDNILDLEIIQEELNLINEEYLFNDDEIFLHALNIKNPNKIKEIIIYIGQNITKKESKEMLSKIDNNFYHIINIDKGITFDNKNKELHFNNKLIKLDNNNNNNHYHQKIFILILLENKGEICTYEIIENGFKEYGKSIIKSKGELISKSFNDIFNNIKKDSSVLNFISPYIYIINGEGYQIK